MSITKSIYVTCRTATHTHTKQHNRQDEQRNMGSEAHDLDLPYKPKHYFIETTKP